METRILHFERESNFGNAKTNLSASSILRFGKVNKNPNILFSNSAPILSNDDSNSNWFFYINSGLTAVGYDGTLQGNPLEKNKFQTTNRDSFFDEGTNYSALSSNNPDQNFLQKKILEEILSDSGSNTSARFIGFIKIGFNFFSISNYFFGVAYNLQTIDFQSTKGLPQKQEWAGFQLGKSF